MAFAAYFVVLIVVVVAGAIVALVSESLIRSAVALGVASAALALLLFALEAPYAAGFELSVGAGLISVLFIIAISLTESVREHRDEA
ncbi:MAG: NADH-quinone oxidoreductase subunit J [Anaerolineae bacterium]